jgi:hypothetical protein
MQFLGLWRVKGHSKISAVNVSMLKVLAFDYNILVYISTKAQ